MIFKQESLGVTVLDVLSLHQTNFKIANRGRPFCALSFRYDSNTVIECNGEAYDVSNSLCYFPSHMDYTRICKQDNLLVIHFENHTYFSNKPELFVPKDPNAYRILFEKALACWNAKESGYQLETSAILYEIFAMAYRENKGHTSENPFCEKAMQIIEQNCFRPDFLVSDIAEQLHISDVYLRKLFKSEFGVSPKKYITQRRIHKAISLLGTNYYSISEIAEQSGFNDPKHFSVEFKKMMGESPSEYSYQFQLSF